MVFSSFVGTILLFANCLLYFVRVLHRCVYIDGTGRKMVVDRSGAAAVPLDRAGVSKEHRFTFYDQYHTTGMDIKQALNAKAVVTLGKDMVWRDYTQGCYRMRGLGRGQTLHILVVPEVHRLIAGVAFAGAEAAGAAASKAPRRQGAEVGAAVGAATAPGPSIEEALPYGEELLIAIVSWLIVNSMRSERLQHVALSQQKIHSVWRKRAFRQLLASRAPAGGESLLPSRFFSPTATVEEAKAIIAKHTVFTRADVARIEKVEEDDAAKKAFLLLLTRLQETGAPPMLIAQLRQVGDGLRAEAQGDSDAARAGMMPWKTALGVASNALKKMGFDVAALLAGTDVDPMTHVPAEIVANVASLKSHLAVVSVSEYSDITLAHALIQVDNDVASAVSFLLDNPPDPALEAQRVEKQGARAFEQRLKQRGTRWEWCEEQRDGSEKWTPYRDVDAVELEKAFERRDFPCDVALSFGQGRYKVVVGIEGGGSWSGGRTRDKDDDGAEGGAAAAAAAAAPRDKDDDGSAGGGAAAGDADPDAPPPLVMYQLNTASDFRRPVRRVEAPKASAARAADEGDDDLVDFAALESAEAGGEAAAKGGEGGDADASAVPAAPSLVRAMSQQMQLRVRVDFVVPRNAVDEEEAGGAAAAAAEEATPNVGVERSIIVDVEEGHLARIASLRTTICRVGRLPADAVLTLVACDVGGGRVVMDDERSDGRAAVLADFGFGRGSEAPRIECSLAATSLAALPLAALDADQVSFLSSSTVTVYANLAHSLTRSP